MRIEASAVRFEVVHQFAQQRERSESLRVWADAVAPAAPPPLSAESPAEAQALAGIEEQVAADPLLQLLRAMVEQMTGRRVRLLVIRRDATPPARIPDPGAARQGTQRAGWGLEYQRRESFEESERTSVAVQGLVRTAEGREIAFTLELSMSREWREEGSLTVTAGDARRRDPLVLSFDGSPVQLSAAHFLFDLDGDGSREELPLLARGQGYLAFDRNGNGVVDNGLELLGPATGDAYAELSAFDKDGNGWIDSGDPAYARLGVWQPSGEGAGTLQSLSNADVGALFASGADSPFSLRSADNAELAAIRATGFYLTESGQAKPVQQVDLVT